MIEAASVDGWRWLIEPTRKGLYLSVNERDGRVAMCIPFEPFKTGCRVDPRYQASKFNGNVADLVRHRLDSRIQKAFSAWLTQLGRSDPGRQSDFVNMTPTIPDGARRALGAS